MKNKDLICEIAGCTRHCYNHKWCNMHWQRWKNHGDPNYVRVIEHKQADHPLHRTYNNIKSRCLNPKDPSYAYYGGRGITICDEWREKYVGFWKFVEHIGDRPSPKHTVDRINNDGDYEPGNVRWATMAEQRLNQRAKVLDINTVANIRHCQGSVKASELAKIYDVPLYKIYPIWNRETYANV